MNYFKTLVLLLVICFSSSVNGADSAVRLRWYTMTISIGTSVISFTGSSPLDAPQISNKLTGTEPIVLENRRYQIYDATKNNTSVWFPHEEGTKLFILPKAVLYFVELPADPASPSK